MKINALSVVNINYIEKIRREFTDIRLIINQLDKKNFIEFDIKVHRIWH